MFSNGDFNRLYHVYRPLSSRIASGWPWKSCIVISWLAAVPLAFFLYRIDSVNEKYYHLWSSELGICMPNVYLLHGRFPKWASFTLITLNLTCFCFIGVGYILIYIRSTKRRPINAESRRTVGLQKQETEMQKRIARIIITDGACWIPIGTMAYAIMGGWRPNMFIINEVTAGFLLPINSALNPFLYSVDLGKLLKDFVADRLKGAKINLIFSIVCLGSLVQQNNVITLYNDNRGATRKII